MIPWEVYRVLSECVGIFKSSEKTQETLTDQSDRGLVVLNVIFQVTGERLRDVFEFLLKFLSDLKVYTLSMMLINLAKKKKKKNPKRLRKEMLSY